MIDFLSFAKKRRTAVEFGPKPISASQINKILEAGRWAPSVFNLQPWHFVVIQDKETIGLITKLCAYNRVYGPPAAMIAVVSDLSIQELGSFYSGSHVPTGEHLKCMGMAALNLVYGAESLGLETALMTPLPEVVERAIGVPATQTCEVIVGIGYASANEPKFKADRLPLNDMVSYEKYQRKRAKLTRRPVKQIID